MSYLGPCKKGETNEEEKKNRGGRGRKKKRQTRVTRPQLHPCRPQTHQPIPEVPFSHARLVDRPKTQNTNRRPRPPAGTDRDPPILPCRLSHRSLNHGHRHSTSQPARTEDRSVRVHSDSPFGATDRPIFLLLSFPQTTFPSIESLLRPSIAARLSLFLIEPFFALATRRTHFDEQPAPLRSFFRTRSSTRTTAAAARCCPLLLAATHTTRDDHDDGHHCRK
ncbi:hypothetical protein B0T19DRAFT_273070 [Cercophora scortea]|uniref:Uncharacterized protein n=1 Tax=Cercophora scortea TaxID=314031 RepID=A0AAE0M5K9_9PEZI|nr:hypothetical protein B0T19DRAFT_273070 [Cercophora scortea]